MLYKKKEPLIFVRRWIFPSIFVIILEMILMSENQAKSFLKTSK